MNAIMGFAQLLELQDLSPQSAQHVQHILRGGRHLLSLLNDLIDLSRIDSGDLQINLEPVELSVIIARASEKAQPYAELRGIEIVNPELSGTLVIADPRYMEQVLRNLVDNAVKYNQDRGLINISISPGQPGMSRVNVRDTGPGLSHAQIAMLFQPFMRPGPERIRVSGAGLGLSVAKQLTGLMGGVIGVESQPGKGCTFWVEFPVAAPCRAFKRDVIGSSVFGQQKRATVLYVAGLEDEVRSMSALLRSRRISF